MCRKLVTNRQNFLVFTLGKKWKTYYNTKRKAKEEKIFEKKIFQMKANLREGVKMESRFYEEDKLLVFKITDEIDDCSVQKIRRKADYEMERYMPKRVIFDFDCVTFMDSAGIGMVIGRYKFANMLGAKLEVRNLTQSVTRIFEMSGILKLIPVAQDLQEA